MRLTKKLAQEVLHKLSILADEAELQADYSITQSQANDLVKSIPCNGGEWIIPAETLHAVKGELSDHALILREIAEDQRAFNAGLALDFHKDAKKLENI